MEKTDVQQRNEDEVRRIMRERGFETALESKPKKKRRDFDFGIIGKVLATIVIVGGLSFGVFALINTPKNDETAKKDASDDNNAAQNADYAGLAACLNAAYTDVEAGDPQFYSKLIASYKAQLDCHSQYPTPDNESEISGIKQRLSSVEIAAKDVSVSQTDIDSADEYLNTEIKSDISHSESQTVTSTQNVSNNDSAESASESEIIPEQKPIQTNTNTKCDSYKSTYGDKTPETLANEDSYVASLYNTWQNWKRQADDWEDQGVVLTQNQCFAYTLKGKVCPRNYRFKAQEAEQTYTNAFNSKVQYYTDLRISACGY